MTCDYPGGLELTTTHSSVPVVLLPPCEEWAELPAAAHNRNQTNRLKLLSTGSNYMFFFSQGLISVLNFLLYFLWVDVCAHELIESCDAKHKNNNQQKMLLAGI